MMFIGLYKTQTHTVECKQLNLMPDNLNINNNHHNKQFFKTIFIPKKKTIQNSILLIIFFIVFLLLFVFLLFAKLQVFFLLFCSLSLSIILLAVWLGCCLRQYCYYILPVLRAADNQIVCFSWFVIKRVGK